ncbi:hypothetical protein, partial [Steroidobacter sp.]|uniref:hypothetical protein n=1 Tax=Steroidobacter sp. TaxID=1978227 RepID=UPI0025F06886
QPLAATSANAAIPAFSVVEMVFFMTSFPFITGRIKKDQSDKFSRPLNPRELWLVPVNQAGQLSLL